MIVFTPPVAKIQALAGFLTSVHQASSVRTTQTAPGKLAYELGEGGIAGYLDLLALN